MNLILNCWVTCDAFQVNTFDHTYIFHNFLPNNSMVYIMELNNLISNNLFTISLRICLGLTPVYSAQMS